MAGLGLPWHLELIQDGYLVSGSTRSSEPAKDLAGVRHFSLDIEEDKGDYLSFLNANTLIVAIPAKNTAAFERLIPRIEQSPIKQVLYISSTSVYPFVNGVVTEETGTKPSPLVSIEQLFLAGTAFKTTVLRFGGLFGYDRRPGNFFKSGRLINYPEGYVNMIHRDDCIGIIRAILRQGLWGEVLNAVADEHPTRRAFYTQEAARVGRTDLLFNEEGDLRYKIVSSQKLQTLLGYAFKHDRLMEG